jgi:hypothetical protein
VADVEELPAPVAVSVLSKSPVIISPVVGEGQDGRYGLILPRKRGGQ